MLPTSDLGSHVRPVPNLLYMMHVIVIIPRMFYRKVIEVEIDPRIVDYKTVVGLFYHYSNPNKVSQWFVRKAS